MFFFSNRYTGIVCIALFPQTNNTLNMKLLLTYGVSTEIICSDSLFVGESGVDAISSLDACWFYTMFLRRIGTHGRA